MNLEAIVAAAQAGDTTARDRLAHLLSTNLDHFLAHTSGASATEREDLRQKVCVVVFEHLQEFEDRGPGSFGRWVKEIARRRVLEGWTAQTRETIALAQFAHHPRKSSRSVASRVTLHELEPQLGTVFGKLSDVQQEAILWDWEPGEREDAELAERLGTTVNAIRVNRSRGLDKLATTTKKMRKTPLPRLGPPPKRASSSSANKI